MIGLLPVFISLFLGFLLLRCLKSKDTVYGLRDLFLAFGLGTGVSSQIVFYSLLVFGYMSPLIIMAIHLALIGGLFFYFGRYASKWSWEPGLSVNQIMILFFLLMIIAFAAVIIGAVRPWGDWDGWSYWNFHANFLFTAGEGWRRIFEFNIQAHHPWFLPLLIDWGWCFQSDCNYHVPLAIAVIFTVATVGLLIFSLKKYISFWWALLAGAFLVSVPYYLQHGTSQYADILAAFFILLSCVLAMDLFKSPSVQDAVVLGLVLGFTASAKDNSSVAALILLVLIMMRLSQGHGAIIKPLLWGFVSTALAVVLMRSFEVFATNNDSYAFFLGGVCSGQKWMIIGQHLLNTLVTIRWGGMWGIVLIVLINRILLLKLTEVFFVLQFMLVYLIFYFLIFTLSCLDLEWLLSSAAALDRTLFLLAPTAIFVLFYIINL